MNVASLAQKRNSLFKHNLLYIWFASTDIKMQTKFKVAFIPSVQKILAAQLSINAKTCKQIVHMRLYDAGDDPRPLIVYNVTSFITVATHNASCVRV